MLKKKGDKVHRAIEFIVCEYKDDVDEINAAVLLETGKPLFID